MPWSHCDRTIVDTEPCPVCGLSKAEWTIQLEKTRTFAVATKRLTKTRDGWLELVLVDGDQPVAGAAYRVRLPSGRVKKGATADDGSARLEKLPAGMCQVSFPDHLPDAMQREVNQRHRFQLQLRLETILKTSRGEPVDHGRFRVVTPEGETVVEGETDGAGLVSVPVPAEGDYGIELIDEGAVETLDWREDQEEEAPWLEGEWASDVDAVYAEEEPSADDPPRLTGAWILDGDDDAEPSEARDQIVNLPRRRGWVGEEPWQVPTLDRLGRGLRVKLAFSADGRHRVKLRLVPGADNLEAGRGDGHSPQDEVTRRLRVDGGACVVRNLFETSVVGGDTFHVRAEDEQGNVVESAPVRVLRRLFLVHLPMEGTAPADDLAKMREAYAACGVELVDAGTQAMQRLDNVGSNTREFKRVGREAYRAFDGRGDLEPYLIAVGYTDHLAVKDAGVELRMAGVTVGPGQADVTVPVVNVNGQDRSLWNDIVPGETWFVAARFEGDDGSDVDLAEDRLEAQSTYGDPTASSLRRVVVRVDGLTDAVQTGTLVLKANVVNRMRGGISLGGNLVCVCTRAWWNTKSNASQSQVLEHEIGHKIHLRCAPNGYTGRGHVGQHCHTGLELLDDFSGARGECTMFGSTSTRAGFCDTDGGCQAEVKKLDLSRRIPRGF